MPSLVIETADGARPGEAVLAVKLLGATISAPGTLRVAIRRSGYETPNLGPDGWQVPEAALLPVEVRTIPDGLELRLGPDIVQHMQRGNYHVVLSGAGLLMPIAGVMTWRVRAFAAPRKRGGARLGSVSEPPPALPPQGAPAIVPPVEVPPPVIEVPAVEAEEPVAVDPQHVEPEIAAAEPQSPLLEAPADADPVEAIAATPKKPGNRAWLWLVLIILAAVAATALLWLLTAPSPAPEPPAPTPTPSLTAIPSPTATPTPSPTVRPTPTPTPTRTPPPTPIPTPSPPPRPSPSPPPAASEAAQRFQEGAAQIQAGNLPAAEASLGQAAAMSCTYAILAASSFFDPTTFAGSAIPKNVEMAVQFYRMAEGHPECAQDLAAHKRALQDWAAQQRSRGRPVPPVVLAWLQAP